MQREPYESDAPLSVDRLSFTAKTFIQLVLNIVVAVIFFLRLEAKVDRNIEHAEENRQRQSKHEDESRLNWAKVQKDIAELNLRIAIIETRSGSLNPNPTR